MKLKLEKQKTKKQCWVFEKAKKNWQTSKQLIDNGKKKKRVQLLISEINYRYYYRLYTHQKSNKGALQITLHK